MDIKAIQDNIEELENANTTVDNVSELASLYIVRDKLLNRTQTVVEREFHDILPEYRKYVEVKTKYQRHEVTEDSVIVSLSSLCKEIREFLQTLYSSTDFYKERRIISQMVQNISEKFS